MVKRILIISGIVLAVIAALLGGLVIFLSVTEYNPAPQQRAEQIITSGEQASAGTTLSLCSWNIGYGGLGKESDFFMDGGSMVDPPSQEIVEKNLDGIQRFMEENPADIWLLQEVDVDSARSGGVDQHSFLHSAVSGNSAFALNYSCPFVPFPLPPIGKVESGIATLTKLSFTQEPQRVSLPCPFSWPVSTANLKRCLLVSRMVVEGTDKELVLINLHLEAYESGEGRIAQTKQLLELMQKEYEKGNYVIAGGDFNQTFPGMLDRFPIEDPEKWVPGVLEESDLPEGWAFAYDDSTATCRLLDQPYCEDCQLYVIDGFILSPNVAAAEVQTVPLDFEYADHNPVRLNVRLLS